MVKTTISIYKKIVSIVTSNIVLFMTLIIGIYLNNVSIEYEPKVVFMNVGQGDAIFILDVSGKKILIDGGDGDYVVYNISKYLHPRDRVIDVMILTHPHQDHISGLIDIMERFEVKQVFFYPACYNSLLYDYFRNLEENISPIPHDWEFIGDSFVLETLYPLQDYSYGECLQYGNINNASIINRLISDSGNILFMGDAEHEQENDLMKNYGRRDIESDILKAGHHCSRTASSERFLNYIDPKYIICSVGEENKFGHPHDEVIELFKLLDLKFDLTYEKDDIVVML